MIGGESVQPVRRRAHQLRRRELMLLLAGAAVASPSSSYPQQPTPVIGWLSVGSAASDKGVRLPALHRGLNEAGYREGKNLTIEYRWAEGEYDRLPGLAADLVRRRVNVIVTPGAPPAFAAKAATSAIPIVFNQGLDPVQSGLIASFNRPGGNITGVAVMTAELAGKKLDLMHELVPKSVLALLVHSANPVTEPETSNLHAAARALGLQPHVLQASTPREIDGAFETLVERRAGALVVSGDPFFTNQADQIVGLAARHGVPTIYSCRQFVAAGGLMSYGPDLADAYRLVGIHTGKILNGASPADLPVEQVVKVEFVINVNTAKTLGLTIPQTILARADDVIE